MSYEGSIQRLCKNGHYNVQDAMTAMYCGDEEKCSLCGEKFVWENQVDETNGSFDDEGKRIDGYVELKVEKETKCKECGHTLEVTYKIPKTKRKR